MGSWTPARDIATRILDLRHHLGLTQPALAELFGRGRKQVSAWERGRQAPPPAVLERAARRHGWCLDIFAEGGPMPSTIVNVPLTSPIVAERTVEYPQQPSSVNGHLMSPARGVLELPWTALAPDRHALYVALWVFDAEIRAAEAKGQTIGLATAREVFRLLAAAAAGPEK